jgi:pyridoxal 5'-phosphate synthase pdxS subunit
MADHTHNGSFGASSFDSPSLRLKLGLAEMLKGGVIMDVMNVEQARIAEGPAPSPSWPSSVSPP